MRPVRRLLALALIALSTLIDPAAASSDAPVVVGDSYFDPDTTVVTPGTTVVWTQQGTLPHSVTADDGSFDSHPACAGGAGCMGNGDSFSRVFATAGTFRYYCKIHGGTGGVGMSGVVKVIDPAAAPTTVEQLQATRSGTTLSVSGNATFGGLAPFEVGTDATGDAAQGLPAVLGYDLTKLAIGQPDPSTGDLVFELSLADLPPSGGLPEIAWYAWDMVVVPPGGTPAGFRISGGLSRANAPSAQPDTSVPSFEVAGCNLPSGQCGPGSDVDAEMDGEANRISVTVPTGALSTIAGTSVVGGEIRTAPFGYQGGIATTNPQSSSPGPMSDQVSQTGSSTVAARSVSLSLVPVGGTPTFDRSAQVAGNGSFTGTLDVSGLSAGAYDLTAKACFGMNCASRTIRVNL